MGKFGRLIRIVMSLGAASLLAGCGFSGRSSYDTWRFEQAVEELARTTRPMRERDTAAPAEAKPSNPEPKAGGASPGSDDRHPSRWKRKLKASYA